MASLFKKKQIVIMKHAESCHRSSGSSWLKNYDSSGRMIVLHRLLDTHSSEGCHPDGNLPLNLPGRRVKRSSWLGDPPLTTMGMVTTQEVGRHILWSKIITLPELGSHVYSSPCLCCIQTTNTLLNTLNAANIKIRIEPAFSNFQQHHEKPELPSYYRTKQFASVGITRMDNNYIPVTDPQQWTPTETLGKFFERQKTAASKLSFAHDGQVLLIVAHGANIYSLPQALRNIPAPSDERVYEVQKFYRDVPDLACTCLQLSDNGQKWSLVPPPVPSFAHSYNPRADWILWYRKKDCNDNDENY